MKRVAAKKGTVGPRTVDVFSGCGGLSLGLRRAGLEVVAAVELDPGSAETYRANHQGTKLLVKDIRSVTGPALLKAARGPVSVVVGCAPCQGFSSLTAKYRREDDRNELVLEMSRIIRELRPAVVMMENVPGLVTRGEKIFQKFLRSLRGAGYRCDYRIVQMADFGVPQYRRRLVLLGGLGFRVPFPAPTHARVPGTGSGLTAWRTVRSSIGQLRAPVTLLRSWPRGGPDACGWHVVRDLQPQTKKRLRAAVPGKTWVSTRESLRPRCHQGYEGFTNTYGRMSWDAVSPTITTGCTTPCRGRFGHPDRRRFTISVREAAHLQTFPKEYAFKTDEMEAVCDMIGNAVPPAFGEAVGKSILDALERENGTVAG